MAERIFEIDDIYFAYAGKFPALAGVTMTVEAGEAVCLLGANGTGKSTLLSVLDGLTYPDRGAVRFDSRPLTRGMLEDPLCAREFRRRVGFVFQTPDVQLFCPTVREDILFGPLQLGYSAPDARKRLEELTERFSIGGLLDRSGHQLSIGEKRKVAIAAVLAVQPQVLLLDEPTAGLDPQTSRQIVELIGELRRQGRTVITATHDLHIVPEICDSVRVFGRDRSIVRTSGPCELLRDDPFLREHNLVHVHAHWHEGVLHAHPHCHREHHGEGS
jgi:cobalt/nickel transport system ATP-binding protein